MDNRESTRSRRAHVASPAPRAHRLSYGGVQRILRETPVSSVTAPTPPIVAQRAVPSMRPDILHQIIAEECSHEIARSLEPFLGLLMNIADVLVGGKVGSSFRDLLSFINGIHEESKRRSDEVRQSQQKCSQLEFMLQQAWHGQVVGSLTCWEQERLLKADVQNLAELQMKLASSSELQRHAMETEQRAKMALHEEAHRHAQANYEHQKIVHGIQGERNIFYTEALRATAARNELHVSLQDREHQIERLQAELAQRNSNLEMWSALLKVQLSCVSEAARFLVGYAEFNNYRDLPRTLKIPMLALECVPGVKVDLSVTWPNIAPPGIYGLVQRLCSGKLASEDDELRLPVLHVNGRWYVSPTSESEAAKFAALLAFQGLRLDIAVVASCDVVLASPAWLNKQNAHGGVGRNIPFFDACVEPISSEALARQLLRGCPFEHELLAPLDRQSMLARCFAYEQPPKKKVY